jgi:hypothetical protein
MAWDSSPSSAETILSVSRCCGQRYGRAGFADDAEVALAEFGRGGLVIHQPAADDEDAGIQRHDEIGDVEAHDPGLEIEDFQRQRIAFLRPAAERQGLFLRRAAGGVQFMAGIFGQLARSATSRGRRWSCRLRRSPNRARSRMARRLAGQPQHLQRHGHVTRLHAGERIAIEAHPIRADERRAEPEPGISIATEALDLPRASLASATPP